MTDQQFIEALEAGEIDPSEFSHESHVRLAFLRLQAHALELAVNRVRSDLQAFAARAGRPQIYDDTLTLRWIERIRSCMREGDDWMTFPGSRAPALPGPVEVAGSAAGAL